MFYHNNTAMEGFTPEELAILDSAVATANNYNIGHTCVLGTPAMMVDEPRDCYACNRDGLVRGIKRPHSPDQSYSTERKILALTIGFPEPGDYWAPERVMEYNRIKNIMHNYAYAEGNYPSEVDLRNWDFVATQEAKHVWTKLSCIHDLD